MHPVRADADETVERREPGRTAAVGREPEGQEARDPNGRGRGRHIRLLLVPDTGEETPRSFFRLSSFIVIAFIAIFFSPPSRRRPPAGRRLATRPLGSTAAGRAGVRLRSR